MAIYEYKCSHCTNKEEQIRKHEDRSKVRECPVCKKGLLKPVVSQTSGFTIEPSKIYV